MLDVAIIGAGPIGSHVAAKLAESGYRTAVSEKNSVIGAKPCCTGIVSIECCQKNDLPSEVIYRQINSALLYSPSKTPLYLQRLQPQAVVLDRPAFDLLMAERARTNGAEYHLSANVEKITNLTEKVVLEVNRGSRKEILEAKMAILAGGFNSPLVKNLGLDQPAYQTGSAQTVVDAPDLKEIEIYFDQELAPGFFAWLVPTNQGKALAGLMTRRSPGLRLGKWLRQLEVEGKIASQKHHIKYGGIPLKTLTQTVVGRTLIVGDAAGQVKPTTGGGIYFGLLCADIAVKAIDNALKDAHHSTEHLSQYDRLWRKRLEPELKREYLARKIYQGLGNQQIDDIFRLTLSSQTLPAILDDEELTFDWHGGLLQKILKAAVQHQAKKIFTLFS